jgi:hypothetical protein
MFFKKILGNTFTYSCADRAHASVLPNIYIITRRLCTTQLFYYSPNKQFSRRVPEPKASQVIAWLGGISINIVSECPEDVPEENWLF